MDPYISRLQCARLSCGRSWIPVSVGSNVIASRVVDHGSLYVSVGSNVLASRVVDHGSLYESAPINDYKSDICSFSEAHTTPRSKNKDFESGLCFLVVYSKQLCTTIINCRSVVLYCYQILVESDVQLQ